MDLLMAFLVVFCGVVPPLLVGVWAYRQGVKGREEAFAMRDEAVNKADAALTAIKALPPMPHVPTVDEIIKALPEPDYSEVTETIKDSVLKSIDGKWGNMQKDFNEVKSKIDKALEAAGTSDQSGGGGFTDKAFLKIIDKFI